MIIIHIGQFFQFLSVKFVFFLKQIKEQKSKKIISQAEILSFSNRLLWMNIICLRRISSAAYESLKWIFLGVAS
jgi:hypothetical protein